MLIHGAPCNWLKTAIAKQGGHLKYNCSVNNVSYQYIDTADGPWSGDEIIIASGAWTQQLARLAQLDPIAEPVKARCYALMHRTD